MYQWAKSPFYNIVYNFQDATILIIITIATSTGFSVNP